MICRRVNSNRWFDHSILVIIALNCITLAMERPAIPPACVVSGRHSMSIIYTVGKTTASSPVEIAS